MKNDKIITFEPDSNKNLTYNTFINLYPNELFKFFIVNATVYQSISLYYEVRYKTLSNLAHPINILPSFCKFYLNCLGLNTRFTNFKNINNKKKIFIENFLVGSLIGSIINMTHVILIRRGSYLYDPSLIRNKNDIIPNLFSQIHLAGIVGGLTIGTFYGLYFTLSSYLKVGDDWEILFKKSVIGLFSSWTGFLFSSFFALMTQNLDYFAYSYKRVNIAESLKQTFMYEPESLLLYLFEQKSFQRTIIFNGINLAVLDYFKLI